MGVASYITIIAMRLGCLLVAMVPIAIGAATLVGASTSAMRVRICRLASAHEHCSARAFPSRFATQASPPSA